MLQGVIAQPECKDPIDIVVPNHERPDLMMRCLSAIYQNTTVPFRLLVIDDSKDPISRLYLKLFQERNTNMRYILSEEPFKEGNQFFNIGLENAISDYVVTISNSMVLLPEWEIAALELMKHNPKIGVVGFKCLYPSGIIESAGISFKDGFWPQDIGDGLPGYHPQCTKIYEATAVQWALALVRKQAAYPLETGVYNGFVGWDDIDNCLVIKKRGWDIYYCGYGVGYHEPRATRGREDSDGRRMNEENRLTFMKRWGFMKKFQEMTKHRRIVGA